MVDMATISAGSIAAAICTPHVPGDMRHDTRVGV